MHGGLTHLLFNMYALAIFGSAIENKLKPNQYLFLYFFSALGSLLLHMAVIPFHLSDVPADIIAKMQTEGAELLTSGNYYSGMSCYIGIQTTITFIFL
jgi:membrane associated rhomboid family serine protease